MALAGLPQYEKPPAGSGILLGGGTSKSPHQPGEQLHLLVDRASLASQTWLFFCPSPNFYVYSRRTGLGNTLPEEFL